MVVTITSPRNDVKVSYCRAATKLTMEFATMSHSVPRGMKPTTTSATASIASTLLRTKRIDRLSRMRLIASEVTSPKTKAPMGTR